MDNNIKKSLDQIRKRISDRKDELNYSYQDLADKTGLSKSTLQRYVTGDIGNIGLDKIELLAKALHTTPSYLMGWEDDDVVTEEDVIKLNDKLNEFGVEIKLVNEDDPDWAVFYNGKYCGNSIVNDLFDIYDTLNEISYEDIISNLDILLSPLAKSFEKMMTPETIQETKEDTVLFRLNLDGFSEKDKEEMMKELEDYTRYLKMKYKKD